MRARSWYAAGLGVLAAGALSLPALANGGDFFEELSATWSAANNADEGVSYFGFIRDTHGRLVADVSVAATTASGSSFVVQSDRLGHYRIPGFSKSVDATKVSVTCSKPGYRLVSRDRRLLRGSPKAPIETDCVLAPAADKPAA
jgi:hypothetical protein